MIHKTDTDRGREALESYLKDCDTHAIVPDVGGAFHAAFMAGRASLPLPGAQEAVAKERFSIPLGRVINAGYALSNCAFNLSQRAGVVLTHETAKTLGECRKDWDEACAAFKSAPQPALSAETELRKVLAAVQRYMPPDGPSAKDTLSEIISIVDPWPLPQTQKE